MAIHKTAIIGDKVILGENIDIGPHTIIDGDTKIDSGTTIGANVVIEDAFIGKDCKIFTGAIIGTRPQDLKYNNEKTCIKIGDRTVIREYVTLNRGTIARGETIIGNDCLLMAYVHVAHDCIVGDNVILANNATLAGHVEVEKGVIIGGLTPIHQFVRIGEYSIVGGASRITQDIIPYSKSAGSPVKLYGLNTIGLERNNIHSEVRDILKKAYRLIFKSSLSLENALAETRKLGNFKEINHLVNFIEKSERGFTRE